MPKEKTILEVRHHALLSSVIIATLLSIGGVLCLALKPLAPYEMHRSYSPVGSLVDSWQMEHPVWSLVIVCFVMIYTSIKLAQLVSRYNLYGVNTPLPMELFPLLSVGIMVNAGSLKGVLVTLFIVYSLMRYISSYRNANVSGVLLSGGVSLGCAVMLYPPVVLMGLVVPFVLIIFERTLREFIVALLSLLIIPFGYIYVQWFLGADFSQTLITNVGLVFVDSQYSIIDSLGLTTVAIGGLVLYLTLNAILVIPQLENTVKARRRLHIVALYALFIGAMLLLPSVDSLIFSLLAIPLSLLIPVTLLRFGRVMSFIFYILLFVVSVANILFR